MFTGRQTNNMSIHECKSCKHVPAASMIMAHISQSQLSQHRPLCTLRHTLFVCLHVVSSVHLDARQLCQKMLFSHICLWIQSISDAASTLACPDLTRLLKSLIPLLYFVQACPPKTLPPKFSESFRRRSAISWLLSGLPSLLLLPSCPFGQEGYIRPQRCM